MEVIFSKNQFWKSQSGNGFQPYSTDEMKRLEISRWPTAITILIHGYSFDPMTTGPDNPFQNQYPIWKRALGKRGYVEFGWYSVPRSFPAIWSAWRSGHWTTYGWAWDLAEQAGEALAQALSLYDGEIVIVAHSLGSRVANCALNKLPVNRVSKVMFWNGADYIRNAERVAIRSTETRFLNIYCPDDTVLERLGDVFAPDSGRCIGNDGLSEQAPRNWIDVDLDAPVYADWAEQLETITRGDNPYEVGDHWETFRYPGNWPLYRAFLNDMPPFSVKTDISVFLPADQVFDRFLANLLKREGGFVDRRESDDPGGATSRGISSRFLSSLRLNDRWSQLSPDVRKLTERQVSEIYREIFFDPLQLPEIALLCQTCGTGLSLPEFLFDIAVMSGVRSSVVLLQKELSDSLKIPLAVDGIVGPQTISAFSDMLDRRKYDQCLRSLVASRLRWLEQLSHSDANPGWISRTLSFLSAVDDQTDISSNA